MNFLASPNAGRNFARPLTNAASNAGRNLASGASSLFSNMWAIMLLILIIFTALVIYYKSIGYYMEIGWNKIYTLISGGESVDITIGGATGTLKPMDDKPSGKMPPAGDRPAGMPGAIDNDGLLRSIGSIAPPRKEVFNVSRNIYKYSDAPAVCAALGAKLATYDQVKQAYDSGADWCNYGWTKGQMAIYPTQRATWEKLQKGSPEYRNACGKVGVNGGYFDNPDLAFGVNCYGVKPPKSATDEMLESQVALPASPAEIEFEKKVQKFRDQMSTINVLPFHKGQWSA
jgi:hypothetical protein